MRPFGFCGLIISSWRGCGEVSQGVVQCARVGKAPGRYCAYGSFVWEWGPWYRNFLGAGFGGVCGQFLSANCGQVRSRSWLPGNFQISYFVAYDSNNGGCECGLEDTDMRGQVVRSEGH